MPPKTFDLGLDGARIRDGALAGVAGAVVFGLMMQYAGMMEMIAMLVRSDSLLVGWVLHLLIGAVFGVMLAALVRPANYRVGGAAGLLWGLALWAISGMVVMRPWLGMPIVMDEAAMMSLAGHFVYGLVAGLVLTWLTLREPAARARPRAAGRLG